ncbi:MAG: ribosome maturation factor RimM [Armatimonadota bacterium]
MARSRRRRSSGHRQRPAPDPNYIELASVVKPHGLSGEVWVDLNTDFPERLPDWPALEIVGRGGPARAHVEYVKGIVGGRCIVKLEGVEDRDQAEAIRNQILRIERPEIPPPPEGAYYDFQIIGLKAVTTDGRELGHVEEILRTGANDVYELDTGVLIPAVENIVKEIDLDEGRILIEPMEGLLD